MSQALPPDAASPVPATTEAGQERLGALLVFLSAFFWSLGGTIGRFLDIADGWTVVFWRSLWAAAFLVCFMLVRDGPRGTWSLFARMGLPGIAVSVCFAIASSAFVVALAHTTVANIVLMQAGVPLIAALISFVLFRERIGGATWAAVAAVIAGVAIMVSDSFEGAVSPVGDLLALTIAISFAIATVITRRFAHVRMTPATCLGTMIAGATAALLAQSLAVSAEETGILFVFGALNLGLGMALFASGARLVPAPVAALLGTFEPVLGPVWVWLVHGEVPSQRTMIGGAIIVVALVVHLGIQFGRPRQPPTRPGTTGLPTPH